MCVPLLYSYGVPPSRPPPQATPCYDMSKRDPRFAGAEYTCFWELAPLAAHYHPSVRAFAEQLMTNPAAGLKYDGDPIHDFSVSQWAHVCVCLCVCVLGRVCEVCFCVHVPGCVSVIFLVSACVFFLACVCVCVCVCV